MLRIEIAYGRSRKSRILLFIYRRCRVLPEARAQAKLPKIEPIFDELAAFNRQLPAKFLLFKDDCGQGAIIKGLLAFGMVKPQKYL